MKYLLFILLLLVSCQEKRENLLKYEKSPYLNQHKDNPVWWMPWGDKAFELAQKENKLVFLSIGYSSCHWCHVMEEESFSDPKIAKILNDHFISIKVDNEERPDLDKIYMEAHMAIRRSGGWPLNMFLNHKREPFYGGTYFRKDKFEQVLTRLSKLWKEDPHKVMTNAQKIYDFLQYKIDRSYKSKVSNANYKKFYQKLWEDFDNIYGGFGQEPKFPPKARIKFLMNYSQSDKGRDFQRKISKMVNYTLQGMFRGGIYDHIGGGFSRYSTDKYWLVPHFEKMLYDNADLASLYFKAYRWCGLKLYRDIGEDILRFVLRDMKSQEGGFYSSIDADSEGEEGKFYLWDVTELARYLNLNESFMARDMFGVRTKGHLGTKNVLNLIGSKKESQAFKPKTIEFKNKLFNIRDKRVHPFKDTKILTSWNGLMISALAEAYKVTKKQAYLDSAFKASDFLMEKLIKDNQLYHRYMKGDLKIKAFRDDYVYLIEGLIELYQVSFVEKYLLKAIELTELMHQKLWSEKRKGYQFSESSKDLIKLYVEFSDNVIKNSNATHVLNLLKLYHLTYNEKYYQRAQRMLEYHQNDIAGFVTGYAELLNSQLFYQSKVKQIAIVGKGADKFLDTYNKEFIPFSVIASSENHKDFSFIKLLKNKTSQKGQARSYICIDKVCKKPTNNIREFRNLILQ